MTKSYRLIRNRISVSLLTLFLLLLIVSVLVNYTMPQKSLKKSIETGFTSDTVAAAKAVDNYFGYITDILMSLALNRDLSNVLSMPESNRNKIENVASYNLVLSVLKDAAKRLQGDLLITVSDYSLYVNKQGEVLAKKLKEESNFTKLAVIESNIPVEIYADSDKLNFRINIVNLLSFKKVGEINLYIPKSNLERRLGQFRKKYNVILLANDLEIIGKFNKSSTFISKSVNTSYGNLAVYLQIRKSNMYKSLKIIQLLFVIMSIVSITLTIFLAYFVARIIMNPLSHLNGLFLSVREKDFTFNISESNFKDEIGYVFNSFKKIADSLKIPIKFLKDITKSEYFDNENYTKIALKSNEAYKSIFRSSNMLVESFQYQDKFLNKILDEAKTYCAGLDYFEDSIRLQMLKLDRLKEINSKIKLEFNKSKENILKVKNTTRWFNETIVEINSIFNEMKKLTRDMDLRVKALKFVELSAKIEVIKEGDTQRYNISNVENLTVSIQDLVDNFRSILLENESMNQKIIEEINNISKAIEKNLQFVENANNIQRKSLANIENLFFLLQTIFEEVEILKQRTDKLAQEVEGKKKDLTKAIGTVEDVLNKCLDLKYQVETIIKETNTMSKLIEEAKAYISAYKI